MEGVPSTPAQRRRSHYIVLTVHGIAEPGKSVVLKQELQYMLNLGICTSYGYISKEKARKRNLPNTLSPLCFS